VDGSAGVDLSLKAAAEATPVSGTIDQPIVSLGDVETKFGGSVAGDVGVSINAGATASLPPFFDKTVSVELFSKTFPIFKASISTIRKLSSIIMRSYRKSLVNSQGASILGPKRTVVLFALLPVKLALSSPSSTKLLLHPNNDGLIML
jgi:hypothetical protein